MSCQPQNNTQKLAEVTLMGVLLLLILVRVNDLMASVEPITPIKYRQTAPQRSTLSLTVAINH